jgi:GNAT superfamily N-acetyltransferase
MNQLDVSVERLTEFSEADAVGIGRLMPFLSENISGEAMDEGLLKAIIDSPYHDQLVARLNGIIVGAATMNLLMGPGASREGYLEDFVTDPEVGRRGVGDKLWQGMLDWCTEHDVNFSFTSRPSREAAHSFYEKHGAVVRDTTAFGVQVK